MLKKYYVETADPFIHMPDGSMEMLTEKRILEKNGRIPVNAACQIICSMTLMHTRRAWKRNQTFWTAFGENYMAVSI